MKRILGIDYGESRIGLALSDPGQFLASPFKTIRSKNSLDETASVLAWEINHLEPLEKIVLGLPLAMSGKDSILSLRVRHIATFLEKLTGIEVILWDERLTTAQVEKTLKEANLSRKKRVQYVDVLSACTILQSFLDAKKD